MPRAPRIDHPGMVHHVAIRGVARAPIFLDDEDRADLLARLDRIVPECGAECLAWALIPNHVHLVVRIGGGRLATLMSRVQTGYARRFNERYTRVGHLFQNRYLSRPVVDDDDLVGVIRYVLANPLRHGVVTRPEQLAGFPWSGYGALLGAMAPRRFHDVDAALGVFASCRSEARQLLRSFLEHPLREDDVRGEEERLELASRAHPLDRAPRPLEQELARLTAFVADELNLSLASLKGPVKTPAAVRARAWIAHLSVVCLGASQASVARALEISERAAARAVAAGARIAREDSGRTARVRARLGESPDRRERPRQ